VCAQGFRLCISKNKNLKDTFYLNLMQLGVASLYAQLQLSWLNTQKLFWRVLMRYREKKSNDPWITKKYAGVSLYLTRCFLLHSWTTLKILITLQHGFRRFRICNERLMVCPAAGFFTLLKARQNQIELPTSRKTYSKESSYFKWALTLTKVAWISRSSLKKYNSFW